LILVSAQFSCCAVLCCAVLCVAEWKLFVGMLNKSSEQEHVRQLFSQFGTVKEVHIIHDSYTNQSKGNKIPPFSVCSVLLGNEFVWFLTDRSRLVLCVNHRLRLCEAHFQRRCGERHQSPARNLPGSGLHSLLLSLIIIVLRALDLHISSVFGGLLLL